MSNYLLLRNNKESGPHTLDDLIKLGLKPYDLIWIQGKSAAWRYPSEVEELKSIAPGVEEQPFDRFFKKTEPTPYPPAVAKDEKRDDPVVKAEYEKYIPKKSVYIAMPGQKNGAKEPIKQAIPPTPVQPIITVSENPVAAQVKYSQPLDEIKEMYVKTLQDRKHRIARKGFLLQNVKRIAALAALVAVGLIAGYLIKSNNGGKKEIPVQANTSQALPLKPGPDPALTDSTKNQISKTEITASEQEKAVTPPQVVKPLHQPTGGFVNKPLHENKTVSFNRSIDKAMDKPISKGGPFKNESPTSPPQARTNTQSLIAPQNADVNVLTGERSRKVRSTETESTNSAASTRRPVINDEFSALVTIKSNEYKKVAFGGIRDLQLTVVNESKFILDNVVVELQYIKPNELPLKTENIVFSSVAPNSTSTLRVPDTNRGIKVTFRIVSIKKKGADEGVADK